MMLDYYGIGTNPLHDDRAAAILLSIINKIPYSHILTMHCQILGYSQCVARFSDTHNALQARQLFVHWIPYGQEILIRDLTIINCLQDIRFSETCNGLQTKPPFMSFGPYMAFHIGKHLE